MLSRHYSVFRWVRRLQSGLLLLVLVWLTASCATTHKAFIPGPNAENSVQVYVVKHGWHTGIIVPVSSELQDAAPFNQLGPLFSDQFDVAYYEFGWGDWAYYPTENPGFWLMLQAAIWPTPSVLQVVALPKSPTFHFPVSEFETLFLPQDNYLRLLSSLTRQFRLDKQRAPIVLDKGLYGNSLFFEARGRFHFFNNCNTWTIRVLQQSGIPVRSFMVFTADSVLNQVRKVRESGLFDH